MLFCQPSDIFSLVIVIVFVFAFVLFCFCFSFFLSFVFDGVGNEPDLSAID